MLKYRKIFSSLLIPAAILGYMYYTNYYNTPEQRFYRAFNHKVEKLDSKIVSMLPEESQKKIKESRKSEWEKKWDNFTQSTSETFQNFKDLLSFK